MPRLELGTIEFSAEFRKGEMRNGSPRMDILQNNIKEAAQLIPDGRYIWTLVLDLETATKSEPQKTIQEVIGRGWIECPKCNAQRTVDAKGNVKSCNSCGDAPPFWNLMVETH